MSKKNRLMIYNKLVAEGRLSQDDGALVREFGEPINHDASYSDMTVARLKKQCDEKGLVYLTKATKDDLVVLLENKSDEGK